MPLQALLKLLKRPGTLRRLLPTLPVLLLLGSAAPAQAARLPEEGRFRVRHETSDRILITDVALSETHISPGQTCDVSGDRVQDETEIQYRVIWPDTIFTAVYIDSVDGTIVGTIQPAVERAPGQTYVRSFGGCPFGPNGRALDDGFYNIVVRAIDDTGRVEDTILPLEIDRTPPVVHSLGETSGTPFFQNGDTIVFELDADRPNYRFDAAAIFRLLDSDADPALTTITDHGDGRYTIRHDISLANTLGDRANILIPIDIRDDAGNLRRDRSQRVCLLNHPPRLVSSVSLSDRSVFRNGDLIRIETAWDSPNGPLTVSADFGNLDDHYDPSRVTITERAGNVFELAYILSAQNTRPSFADYRLRVTVHDQACGAAVDTSIVLSIDNEAPPKPVHDAVPATVRSPTIDVAGSAPEADRVEVRRNNILVDTAPVGANARFTSRVSLLRGANTIVLEALDTIGNRSAPDTIRVGRDVPPVPVIDPLPPTTRDDVLTLSGLAAQAVRVEVRRGSSLVDSAHVDESGRFAVSVALADGRNNLTVESVNNVGMASTAVSVTILKLSGTFVQVPSRFVPGTGSSASRIELGLTKTGRSVRVELWSLSGDLLSVIESRDAEEVYTLGWDGRDSKGQAVGSGPILTKIDIEYEDGSRESVSKAFVLVRS